MLMVRLIILCVLDKMNSREQLRKITNKKKDSNMDPANLHPVRCIQSCINDLGDDGIDDDKDEMGNDRCDDLLNDVPPNRDNRKGDHHLLPGLNTRKMSVYKRKLTGTL